MTNTEMAADYKMKQRNRTVAVVVTFNRKELLSQCVEKLLRQIGASCDVLIIDNASTDGTEEFIKEKFGQQEVTYENTGRNLGGAGGFEYGVGKAVRLGYEYVWIMDDDTLPEETALAELFAAHERLNGKWGFLSSVAYWTDGSVCQMNIQKKDIFRHVGKKEYRTEIVPIKMCSFVSLLVKCNVVRELGLPIGAYFIWTDDYEFTGRISRKYPCYMIPKSKVIHAMRVHTRVDFAMDDVSRIDRYRCIYRNDVHCYRQYGIAGGVYLMAKDIYTVLHILKNAKGEKWKRICTVLNGFREGLRFHPRVMMPEYSLVSCVVITHNRCGLLKRAVASIESQSYPNKEIVIVDDASTDDTPVYGQECLKKGYQYIRIEPQDSKGGNHARNCGILAARGDYVAFLDDDDQWLTGKLEKQMAYFSAHPEIGMVYTGYWNDYGCRVLNYRKIPDLGAAGDVVAKQIYIYPFALTITMMVRRELLIEGGGFDENLRFWQEYELTLRLIQRCLVGCIPEALSVANRIKKVPRLSSQFEGWLQAVRLVDEKHRELFKRLDEEKVRKRKELFYREAACRACSAGDRDKMREYYRKAYQLNPKWEYRIGFLLGLSKNDMVLVRAVIMRFFCYRTMWKNRHRRKEDTIVIHPDLSERMRALKNFL